MYDYLKLISTYLLPKIRNNKDLNVRVFTYNKIFI